jgi:hypothetical protein
VHNTDTPAPSSTTDLLLLPGRHSCESGPLCGGWGQEDREPACEHNSCWRITMADCRGCFDEAMEEAARQDALDAAALAACEPFLVFRGQYGAPGVGSSYKCTDCGMAWSKVGGHFYPAESGAHILSPSQVV